MYTPNPYVDQPIAKAMVVRHAGKGPIEPLPLANSIPVALLRTCRQLHAESSAIFYGANVFRIWFLSDTELSFAYRRMVRHVIFTAEVDRRIFGSNMDEVGYWWKRRFWPSLTNNAKNMLGRFPCVKTLTFPLKAPHYGETWRPAFFAVENKTRDQRISLAASWMNIRCPWENERLRECLQMTLVPATTLMKEDYRGSRFPEDEWDSTEFADAFELMKCLG
jgi:hypothetical protein